MTSSASPRPSPPDDWRDDAACKGEPTALWFPDGNGSARAKIICATCPVAEECRAEGEWEWGVWGGLTADERRTDRRGSRQLKPCGTRAAFIRHQQAGEEPCVPCRVAENDYKRTYKRGAA